MKNLHLNIFLVGCALLFISASCETDEDDNLVNTQDKANELVLEIRDLIFSSFPSNYDSWSLSNKTYNGDASGSCTIDGSYTYKHYDGWSTYSSYYTYNDVYISFDNYQDRTDSQLVISGLFNLNGTIHESGSVSGSSPSSGNHALTGVFSVTGKFTGENVELYFVSYGRSGLNFMAILKTGDKEWEVNYM